MLIKLSAAKGSTLVIIKKIKDSSEHRKARICCETWAGRKNRHCLLGRAITCRMNKERMLCILPIWGKPLVSHTSPTILTKQPSKFCLISQVHCLARKIFFSFKLNPLQISCLEFKQHDPISPGLDNL